MEARLLFLKTHVKLPSIPVVTNVKKKINKLENHLYMWFRLMFAIYELVNYRFPIIKGICLPSPSRRMGTIWELKPANIVYMVELLVERINIINGCESKTEAFGAMNCWDIRYNPPTQRSWIINTKKKI